ncbi:GNAT family N-acetyltransferase [Pseudomonas sp.]|uniref:GNAT family N-acetyltransferase n=1 Tax=Pseudomonas sp. TaxID=306 RepID=UPI002896B3A3|nr:GNAT family N-acetyltransferase [Pseudomonas sp.]
MEVTIGKGPELIKQAQSIRYQVFTLEQNIPTELDLDGLDEVSFHALVRDKYKSVATARLTVKENGSSVMARVAVLEEYRGLGIASKIVKALIEHADNIDVASIEIHAHGYLRGYYEQFGFEFIKEVEIVGDHELIEMQLQLK